MRAVPRAVQPPARLQSGAAVVSTTLGAAAGAFALARSGTAPTGDDCASRLSPAMRAKAATCAMLPRPRRQPLLRLRSLRTGEHHVRCARLDGHKRVARRLLALALVLVLVLRPRPVGGQAARRAATGANVPTMAASSPPPTGPAGSCRGQRPCCEPLSGLPAVPAACLCREPPWRRRWPATMARPASLSARTTASSAVASRAGRADLRGAA